jgi:hypothetical protein
LIGTYYATAGGVLKNLKLTIFAGRWHQGGKTLLLYIAGMSFRKGNLSSAFVSNGEGAKVIKGKGD